MHMRTPAAAEYCGVSPALLKKLRRHGGGPPYARIGHRTVIYTTADLDAWVAALRVGG